MRNSNNFLKEEPSGGLSLHLLGTTFTRRGIAFEPADDLWEWIDGLVRVHLDFRRLKGPLEIFKEPLKIALLPFAKGSSASHLSNLFHEFMHFLASRDKGTQSQSPM